MEFKSTINSIAVLFILMMVFGNALFAQISISSEDVLNLIGISGVVELDTTENVTVNVGSSGANQMWDFTSDVIVGTSYDFEYITPEGTPLASEFPNANMTQTASFTSGNTSTTMYIYFSVTASKMSELGGGMYIASPDTLFQVLNGGSFTPLPVNYEDQWVAVKSDTNDLGQGIFLINKSVTTSTVDAWGTVKIPAGEFECLRIREDRADTSKSVFLGEEVVIGSSSTISYLWLGKENAMLVSIESQDGETNPNFTNAYQISRLKDASSPNAIESENTDVLPTAYALNQNYPNPFNPTTKISFTIPESQNVKLSVFNSLGQQVRTILNENRKAGYHEVEFNAIDLPSGTYFYQIEAGRYKNVRKMLIIK